MTAPGAPHPGPLGEEAARLAAALGEWLGERLGPLAAAAQRAASPGDTAEGTAPDGPLPWWASGRARDDESADGTGAAGTRHGPDCRYCPVCQLIGHVRALRPDVADHLADAAAALTAAARAAAQPGSAGRSTRVEHIDIA